VARGGRHSGANDSPATDHGYRRNLNSALKASSELYTIGQ